MDASAARAYNRRQRINARAPLLQHVGRFTFIVAAVFTVAWVALAATYVARLGLASFIGMTVDSEISGNVIDLCPVGALTSKPFRYSARTWELARRKSVSPHDGLGANVIVQTKNQRVMRVVPLSPAALPRRPFQSDTRRAATRCATAFRRTTSTSSGRYPAHPPIARSATLLPRTPERESREEQSSRPPDDRGPRGSRRSPAHDQSHRSPSIQRGLAGR